MTHTLKGQCIAEFFGTALFIFFGTSCLCAVRLADSGLNSWDICIVWGFAISLSVYLTAGISGAHLNPAVTIAFWLFANFEPRKVIPYSLSQLAGTFCGAALCYYFYQDLFVGYIHAHHILLGTENSLYLAGIFTTFPHPAITVTHAFMVEVILTAIMMCLIMSLTDDGHGVPRGALAPLLIGIMIGVIGAAAGPLTGYAMNPARDFGTRLFIYLAGWGNIAMTGGRDIPYVFVPLIAPVIGTCIGAITYRVLIVKYFPSPYDEQQMLMAEQSHGDVDLKKSTFKGKAL